MSIMNSEKSLGLGITGGYNPNVGGNGSPFEMLGGSRESKKQGVDTPDGDFKD